MLLRSYDHRSLNLGWGSSHYQYIGFLNSKSFAKIEWYSVDNLNSLSKIQLNNKLKKFDWGKATNKRLSFLKDDELFLLRESVLKAKNQLRFLDIDWISQEEQSLLEQAIKEYIKYF